MATRILKALGRIIAVITIALFHHAPVFADTFATRYRIVYVGSAPFNPDGSALSIGASCLNAKNDLLNQVRTHAPELTAANVRNGVMPFNEADVINICRAQGMEPTRTNQYVNPPINATVTVIGTVYPLWEDPSQASMNAPNGGQWERWDGTGLGATDCFVEYFPEEDAFISVFYASVSQFLWDPPFSCGAVPAEVGGA
jgi:hypothetical protein